MKRTVNALSKRNRATRALGLIALYATTAVVISAQTLTTLFTFDHADGDRSQAQLLQGIDGDFYGTTFYGGSCTLAGAGCGTIFKVTASGTLTNLYSFCPQPINDECPDGAFPAAALVQASNGDLYGTTEGGGTNPLSPCGFAGASVRGCGTIFKVTPSGTLTTLHSFCPQTSCADGLFPRAALVQATDGNFYGTTSGGGGASSAGTIFKITASGSLTTLYNFCAQSGCSDGSEPYAPLIQAASGDFYGTTAFGGVCFNINGGCGTIFKITAGGTLTTLHSFCFKGTFPGCPDGANPYAALIQAADGDFYGVTYSGGAGATCASWGGCGTVFKIAPGGTLTTIYSFCSQGIFPACMDGIGPSTPLIQATDGEFYGTTQYGGAGASRYCVGLGCGTVFQITPSGTLTTLHSFCTHPVNGRCPDGAFPAAGLDQGTNGNLYGTTFQNHARAYCNTETGCGTVFSLSVNVSPSVKTQSASGR